MMCCSGHSTCQPGRSLHEIRRCALYLKVCFLPSVAALELLSCVAARSVVSRSSLSSSITRCPSSAQRARLSASASGCAAGARASRERAATHARAAAARATPARSSSAAGAARRATATTIPCAGRAGAAAPQTSARSRPPLSLPRRPPLVLSGHWRHRRHHHYHSLAPRGHLAATRRGRARRRSPRAGQRRACASTSPRCRRAPCGGAAAGIATRMRACAAVAARRTGRSRTLVAVESVQQRGHSEQR